MKYSLRWLDEFVSLDGFLQDPQKLSQVLTFAGFEVEGFEDQSARYQSTVIGIILKKEKHPNADRLTVCQVTTGHGVIHQIVCGAQNHQINDRVVVALPGAVLPNGTEIRKTQIRNVESEGMLCSASELGLSEKSNEGSEGIMILPPDAPVGEAFSTYWQLNDVIMDIKVTPNRPDCLSHRGLARELSILLRRPLKDQVPGDENITMSLLPETSFFKVQIKDKQLCPTYLGAEFDQVCVGPSPLWLQRRLNSLGLRSINNVVDVTNYILLERGQPLHAFDWDRIDGNEIHVRGSLEGETFKALDGVQHSLKEGYLCIADQKKILALAGIIGGFDSAVCLDTKRIFLEAAVFKPDFIRRSSRSLGISTDSSDRFSRGVEAQELWENFLRAIQLMVQVTQARLVGINRAYNLEERRDALVRISTKFVEQKLGYSVSEEDFLRVMKQIGCRHEGSDHEQLILAPPVWRRDLEMDVDLVEEYGRINGYDKIPETLPMLTVAPSQHDFYFGWQSRIRHYLTARGYHEVVTSFFVSSRLESQFFSQFDYRVLGLGWGHSVKPLNPLSEQMDSLRRSLCYSLFERASYNIRNGLEQGYIFEINPVAFHVNGAHENRKTGYQEEWRLALCAWGTDTHYWDIVTSCPLVLKLKQEVLCLPWFSLSDRSKDLSSIHVPPFAHPGRFGVFYYETRPVGFCGEIHPDWQQEFKKRIPIVFAELNLSWLLSCALNVEKSFQPFSRFPFLSRDLAVVVPKSVAFGEVFDTIQLFFHSLIQDLHVFDIYEGQEVKPGCIQYGFRMKLQKPSGSLVDDEVNRMMENLIQELREKFQAELPVR
ncbi:MAG: phenylalanine--tRNA ligase subunit beta [Bdellovibrionaceae bacterium]|nr:phenylalanine--tRNA ligase subunit beta [Pseudobdellovibrionaceae bacterium]MDW8190704.1 phenylalanine--tRNA ligase subunit beta [Pseudobdellovibrionaceae bacterium]